MKIASPLMFLLLAGVAKALAAQEPSEAELIMKAGALASLPRYVEWPEGAFVVEKTPLMLGVYGRSKVHTELLNNVHGRVINGRRVMVRRFRWPQRPNSHVLFIARSERHRLRWLMKRVEHSSTLTVAEFDDFLTYDGVLRMSMKEGKLCFHVNNTVAKHVGLKFSSQFLNVADQIVGGP